jgi:hypothetical protein
VPEKAANEMRGQKKKKRKEKKRRRIIKETRNKRRGGNNPTPPKLRPQLSNIFCSYHSPKLNILMNLLQNVADTRGYPIKHASIPLFPQPPRHQDN